MSLASVAKAGLILVQPSRSIGGLYPDIIVEEVHEDSLEITSHPVEQGAEITDHAFKQPQVVTLRGGVSDSSLRLTGEKPSVEFYNKLLELQSTREVFDIVTSKRLYTNMMLEVISVVTDPDSENSLLFTAQCREVVIVATQVTTVPPRSKHANPWKTGETTNAGQKQPQKRKSMLKGGLG